MPPDSDEILWSQYEDLGVLGYGGCSKILLARHLLTRVPVAIKVLEKEDKLFHHIEPEVDLLKTINHPNIITLFQVIETKHRIYLVLELCMKSLDSLICTKGHLEEEEARGIFWQVLEALSYCHQHGIAHRDIKADNIMLQSTGKVILLDFGLATTFRPGEKFTYRCSPYAYVPPELYRQQPYDATQKDMWALGILLFYMVTGTLPFDDDSVTMLKRKVLEGTYPVPDHLSDELAELISFLLTVDPDLRSPAKELMTHPWLQKCRGGSSHQDTLPRSLDPDILEAMRILGFDPGATRQSILRRRYDQAMGTYLLLQYRAACIREQNQGPEKPVFPGKTPFPSLSHPASFPPHPKRTQVVPGPQAGSSLLKLGGTPEDGQQPEPKASRSASSPNIPLSCPRLMPAVSPSLKRLRSRTAPGTLFPSHTLRLPDTMPSFQISHDNISVVGLLGTYRQGSSLEFPEETSSSDQREEKPAAPSGQGPQGPGRPAVSHRGLRRWKTFRRIENGMRTLFQRLRSSLNSHPLKNRVAPVTVPNQQPPRH